MSGLWDPRVSVSFTPALSADLIGMPRPSRPGRLQDRCPNPNTNPTPSSLTQP